MFHGVVIEEVVYKVEVHGVMLHATTFMFPNLKKDLSFHATITKGCEGSIHILERCEHT
jgi:hypothetical protein